MDNKRILWLMVFIPLVGTMELPSNRGEGELSHVVCPSEVFRAVCDVNEVILITRATYGRMELNRCRTKNFGFSCSNNVTDVMHVYCSGRHHCDVKVLDDAFPSIPTCHEDLKSYLEVSYTCIQVATPQNDRCDSETTALLTSAEGYISSVVSAETSCGSPGIPWEIRTDLGQQIQITLIDFSSQNSALSRTNSRVHISTPVCRGRVYVTLSENGKSRTSTICAEDERERQVFTSVSNSVKVILHTNSDTNQGDNDIHFLLYYKAVGCKDPDKIIHGWVQRTKDVALTGCDADHTTYTIKCRDGKWQGQIPNCTKGTGPLKTTEDPLTRVSLPLGIIIIIIVGLALVIGLLVLVCGLWMINNRNAQQSSNNSRREMLQNPSSPVEYHQLCPKHEIRACDYEPCPTSQCAIHSCVTSPGSVISGRGKEQEYGAVHLQRTTPDIIQRDENELYDQSRFLIEQNRVNDQSQRRNENEVNGLYSQSNAAARQNYATNNQSANSTAEQKTTGNGKNAMSDMHDFVDIQTLPHKRDRLPLMASSPVLQRVNSSDALIMNPKSMKPAEKLATIHRSPRLNRTNMTLPVSQQGGEQTMRNIQISDLDIRQKLLPIHSYACLQNSKGRPFICKCPTNRHMDMRTFKAVPS